MASNFVKPGNTLTVALPYNRDSGQAFKVGNIFGVASVDGTTGDVIEAHVEGVFDITTLTTDTPSAGTIMYWDDSNRRLTTTASTHLAVGYAVAAKASGAANTRIKLIPKSA